MSDITTQDIIASASKHLLELQNSIFDILTLSKPKTIDEATNLAKVVSKLSPLVGNLIEFRTVEFLNNKEEFNKYGLWKRQDPGFPDAIFEGEISPTPGFEIKAWFPLATEITARFKDSQNHFQHDQTHVAMLAWLPEYLIYGKPKIIDVIVVSGLSVAKARDYHYHKPPDYLVLEPEDTTARTQNLQQTNTNGYKFQGTPEQFKEAKETVNSWGEGGHLYKPTPEYQKFLRSLIRKYRYRLDTNFAKMDRIVHGGIEDFKTCVYNTKFQGVTIGEWNKILSSNNDDLIRSSIKKIFDTNKDALI